MLLQVEKERAFDDLQLSQQLWLRLLEVDDPESEEYLSREELEEELESALLMELLEDRAVDEDGWRDTAVAFLMRLSRDIGINIHARQEAEGLLLSRLLGSQVTKYAAKLYYKRNSDPLVAAALDQVRSRLIVPILREWLAELPQEHPDCSSDLHTRLAALTASRILWDRVRGDDRLSEMVPSVLRLS